MNASLNSTAPHFDAMVFEKAVAKKMKNKVKGYAFSIGNKEGISASYGGGWAQGPDDGDLKMTGAIASCIGSVTKMFSATALLNLLEADPDVRLDDPVFNKLPQKWQQRYKDTHATQISYRQLLQHRSGFRKDGD
ncbi:MAG: serine hydrolase domain-containing protein, partial [Niabella sp.]